MLYVIIYLFERCRNALTELNALDAVIIEEEFYTFGFLI